MILLLTEIITAVFVISFLIQLYFYLVVFKKLATYEQVHSNTLLPGVSVIICAKNEAVNLKKNLKFILEQNYHAFEVIVVNDASTDTTLTVLNDFKSHYPHLSILNLAASIGKKNALTQGIKNCRFDYLLLTDADCKAQSSEWIKSMARNFSLQKEIVLGYGAYEYMPGFLNQLIRFDTFYIAVQYLSFALWGKAYMGVGRNLAYKKKLFSNIKGFENHKTLLSGDDDLFINEVAHQTNVGIEISPESHTLSTPKNSWTTWIFQKRRHLTTGVRYQAGHQFRLGLFQAGIIGFYASFAYLIIETSLSVPLICFFLIRFFLQIVIFKACAKKMAEKHNFILFPFFELIMLFLNLILVLSNTIYKPNTWQKN